MNIQPAIFSHNFESSNLFAGFDLDSSGDIYYLKI